MEESDGFGGFISSLLISSLLFTPTSFRFYRFPTLNQRGVYVESILNNVF